VGCGSLDREEAWRCQSQAGRHVPGRPSAPTFGNNELLGHGVLLAAEVVSPHSQRRDRVTKLRAYAQGRVPLYLLVDQLADPATVTLFSEPDESSYRTCTPATAGQALRLPEPFGIALDTRRLLG